MDKKAMMIGMAVGTAAGAAMTLLNTPISGKEARQKVKDAQASMKASANEIKNDLQEIQQSVTHLTEVSKEQFSDVSTGLKTSAALWKESIVPNKQALQKEISALQTTVHDMQETLPSPPKTGEPK
ncbi:gas vesicle protein [Bacillus ectoiniformans]|nr:gas vesicle protein [Bacillus ectoiniformans]